VRAREARRMRRLTLLVTLPARQQTASAHWFHAVPVRPF
jgi:hypothetical protein